MFNKNIYWHAPDRRNYYIKDHLGSIGVVVDEYGQITSAIETGYSTSVRVTKNKIYN